MFDKIGNKYKDIKPSLETLLFEFDLFEFFSYGIHYFFEFLDRVRNGGKITHFPDGHDLVRIADDILNKFFTLGLFP